MFKELVIDKLNLSTTIKTADPAQMDCPNVTMGLFHDICMWAWYEVLYQGLGESGEGTGRSWCGGAITNLLFMVGTFCAMRKVAES